MGLVRPICASDLRGDAPLPQPTDISPETAHCWVADGEAILIDVPEPNEVDQARLAEAVHVPMSAL